jgi:imidazolonepropionase
VAVVSPLWEMSGPDTELTAVVHDAAEVVVGPRSGTGGVWVESGDELLRRHEDAAVAVVDGRVAAVGDSDSVTREYPPENARNAVDAAGRAVVPGFVDAHTHACFVGDRSDEFAARLRGQSYEEIAAEGGGILRTVEAVRAATEDELVAALTTHLDAMLGYGTTTVEVKSGYGLDVETELRMLSAIDRASRTHPVDVVPTFMGAHAVPDGQDAHSYAERVADEQVPAVADQGIAVFCDVFCDRGAFSVAEAERVLVAGMTAGLSPKVHAEELAHRGGARLAAQLGATSADHLLHATAEDARALANGGVTPVVLPGTAFSLGAGYADARALLSAGDGWTTPERVPLALGTDFNPNCHSRSMPFAVALACVEMDLAPAEALLAATRGGASALDLSAPTGTLEEGAPADLCVLSGPSYVHVPYQFGDDPVDRVLKRGEVVAGD